MRKRSAVLVAASALAAGVLGCGLAARPYVDPATGRYPGAQIVGLQNFASYSPASQSVERQGTYQTDDGLTPVRAWYAHRLQVLASADNVPASGDCVWMSRSQHVVFFQYSASVLMCRLPPGTRITLNESLALRP